MANFQPMKDRFLLLLRHNLELLSIRGSFLDYGCGAGDVSEFLAALPLSSRGVGYDPSLDATEVAKRNASSPDGLEYRGRRVDVRAGWDFAVLLDVIEHVPDAQATLRDLHGLVTDGGWLFVTVPYNAHEWGVDDEYYGHLRRLSRKGIITLLENGGWNVIRVLDPTFPSFWFLRRSYLLLRRLKRFLGLESDESADSDMDRSLASSRQSAWEDAGVISRILSSSLVPWRFIRLFDLYFESIFLGFELFVVCQKSAGSRTCEVCGHGEWSYSRFFDRYSLQSCSYCSSELLLPDPLSVGIHEKKPVRPVGRILETAARSRARKIDRLAAPPDRSVLDLRPRSCELAKQLHRRGWQVRVAVDDASSLALEEGVERVGPRLEEIPEEKKVGVVVLHHVVEHMASLGEALEQIDRLLLPGGYLVLEYPSGRSWLKALLGWRWFGHDPPHHRLLIHPGFLSDRLGIRNYRLIEESNFSWEYSFFIFAQSWANALLPFQRDSVFRMLTGCRLPAAEWLGVVASVPIFALSTLGFLLYQPLASLFRGGCIVRQTFRKTDIV